MLVFKFGGASVKDAAGVTNLAEIVKKYEGQQLLIVVSAMGKTTNALEKVAEAFYDGKKEEALKLFQQVKNNLPAKTFCQFSVRSSISIKRLKVPSCLFQD